MKFRSKMTMATAVAIVTATAALATGNASTAEARGWKHFRHGKVGFCVGNRRHHQCWGHRYGHRFGFRHGYGFRYAGNCGWQWITIKKWNASYTRLLVIRDKVWNCY